MIVPAASVWMFRQDHVNIYGSEKEQVFSYYCGTHALNDDGDGELFYDHGLFTVKFYVVPMGELDPKNGQPLYRVVGKSP